MRRFGAIVVSLLVSVIAATLAATNSGGGASVPAGTASGAVSSSSCQLDPRFFYDGSIVSTRDLAYLKDRCARALTADVGRADQSRLQRLKNTIALIEAARARYPQAILFRVTMAADESALEPQHWHDDITVTQHVASDVVIIGAEIPSLTAAIDAVHKGYSVTVAYSGPLGGICADSSANMRFFDFVSPTSVPESMRELFHKGLGIGNYVTVPPDIDSRLMSYFEREYSRRVRFVQTESYDSLHVQLDGAKIAGLVTDEGVEIDGRFFIDTDPESRVAEKAGVSMNIETPDLACGLVFDVSGLTAADWRALEKSSAYSPRVIMNEVGATKHQVSVSRPAYASYSLLARFMSDNHVFHGMGYRGGYKALAQGFDFYMQCKGLLDPDNSDLVWLNEHRRTSGFNVSAYRGVGTFNSIDYRFGKAILQHSHNLSSDEQFAPIRQTEAPALEDYFRFVTGDDAITVRIPPELYVRGSTAFFKTEAPYTSGEFNNTPKTRYFTYYPMDLRGLFPRDAYNWDVVTKYMNIARGKHFWDCRPSATRTCINNLFLINKDSVTPAFSGGQRVLVNQINMAAALMNDLSPKMPINAYKSTGGLTLYGTVGHLNPKSNRIEMLVQSVEDRTRVRTELSPARQKTIYFSEATKVLEHKRASPVQLCRILRPGEAIVVSGADKGAGAPLNAESIRIGDEP